MLLASGCSSVVGGGALMGEGVGWEGATERGGMRFNMGGGVKCGCVFNL